MIAIKTHPQIQFTPPEASALRELIALFILVRLDPFFIDWASPPPPKLTNTGQIWGAIDSKHNRPICTICWAKCPKIRIPCHLPSSSAAPKRTDAEPESIREYFVSWFQFGTTTTKNTKTNR